jgi:ribosomal protein S18 acetylase RimI-like enzyme
MLDQTAPSGLERQTFDEAAFGKPYYRITSKIDSSLASGMASLRKTHGSFVIDAKVSSDDLEASRILQCLGFRKVCMQIKLVHDLAGAQVFDSSAQLSERVEWPASLVAEHAKNFKFDRFALDGQLPAAGHDRLYCNWIENSLTGPGHRVLRIGHSFVTFGDDGEGFRIDLLSVLERRRGIGRRLLNSLASLAKTTGRKRIVTVTECENRAAVRLYLQTGFKLADFQAVFHYVEPEAAEPRC